MRLLILSLLALGYAHGHTLAYRTNLLSYAPARGEFPVEHGRGLGYVRYLDGSGAERLLPYYYPEPLYGVRHLSYGALDSVHPLLRTTSGSNIILKQETSSEQNALFRAWCEERYNALKKEFERLRSEGQTPSDNMMAQLIPLEQIIKASAFDSSIVSGLSPEVQRARDEHLRMWNESRIRVLKAEEDHQMHSTGTKLSGEYKPQEDLQLKQFDVNSRIGIESQGKPIVPQLLQPVQDTPEVLRAREEHLKLFQQISSKQQQQKQSSSNQVQWKEYNAQLSKSHSGQALQPIQGTSEEHLKLLNEEKLKLGGTASKEQQQQLTSNQYEQKYETESALKSTPHVNVNTRIDNVESKPIEGQLQPVKDTIEIQANLKAQSEGGYQQYQQKYETESAIKYTPQINVNTRIDNVESKPIVGLLQPVQDTPEVIRAREEHLRLIEQAKLKAKSEGTFNEYDDGSYKTEQQQQEQFKLKLAPGIQQPIQQIQQPSTLLYQGIQPNLKSSAYNYQEQQQQQQQQWGVQETAEVLKAREEHLRLLNEAKVRIEDRIADDSDRIKLLDREGELNEYEMRREEEKQQEIERLREETREREEKLLLDEESREAEKQQKLEKLRDEERQKEEKRLLEEERIALQLEEQRRLDIERAEEAERIRKEELEKLKYKAYEYQGQPELLQQGQILTKFIAQPQQQLLENQLYQQSLQQAQIQQKQQQLQQGGILLRIQPHQQNLYSQIGQEIGSTGGQYYIPATKENPFLVRYTQDVRPLTQEYIKPIALTTAIVTPGNLLNQGLKSEGGYAIQSGSSSSSASASSSSLSSGSSSASYVDSSNISELDKAARNHFRAHEIALEQLRLAKQKNPWLPDCI